MDDREIINRIQELVRDRSSLKFSPSRVTKLEHVVADEVRNRGLSGNDAYLKLITDELDELDALVESLTTKETYFHRLPKQFSALVNKILPELEEELSKHLKWKAGVSSEERKVPINIWSAGCSTGQEPYTIAMALKEGLRYPRAWKVEILATDISKKALETGSRGVYDRETVEKAPRRHWRWFNEKEDGQIEVSQELKNDITFMAYNLKNMIEGGMIPQRMRDLAGNHHYFSMEEKFHLVFCRNVMIYFDLFDQQKLVDNLFRCVKPGGYFFTGDAELLHIYKHGFETIEVGGTYIYRRPKAHE